MIVRQVNPIFIHRLWPDVKPMLDKAMEHSAGEYDTEQLKVMLVNGSQTLLVAEDEGKIYGAATIVFENYPNDRIAFITSIGGKMLANKNIWNQYEAWCKANGCTKTRGYAFEAVARLWKKRFGMEPTYIIVEKKL
jgi:hypothetical protein